MISNYTISGLKSLKDTPHLNCAQYTLNGHTHPSKRDSVKALRDMAPYYRDTDIIVHYDFVYIISRYALLSQGTRNSIVRECIEISNYALENSRIKGIVMHTDWPMRKDCFSVEGGRVLYDFKKIVDNYKSSLWDLSSINDICDSNESLLKTSLDLFYRDFMVLNSGGIGCKVYLETTVNTGPNNEGTLDWIRGYITNSGYGDLYGVVYDMEHEYASTGTYLDILGIKLLSSEVSTIVHLNVIPPEVTPGSHKDRHSYTTIFDCSLNSPDFYLTLSSCLEELGIPFVREVKEDVMYNELKLISSYARKGTDR